MSKQTVHASCVALDGRAVLLMGVSGSGKSDLAVRLIDRGWSLVSDDYVTLERRGGKLVAAPPQQIAGRMEVRHVGLIRLPFVTGVPVCLAIFLDREPERLPDADVWNHAGIAVPAFALHGLEPSAPLKVEHLLRVNGHAVE